MTMDNGARTIPGLAATIVDRVTHLSDDFLNTITG